MIKHTLKKQIRKNSKILKLDRNEQKAETMLHPELIFAILSVPMFSFVCIMAFKQKVLLDTKRNVSMRVLI